MDHATCAAALLATHFATSLLPLTGRLIPVITEVGRLIVRFRRADLTPQACHHFETQLQVQLRKLGLIIVEWTFNHIEPHDRREMPNQMCFQGVWYRRRFKTAQPQGRYTLWHYHRSGGCLYQPLHGVEPSIFPMEMRLGLEAGLATPALTERVAQAATVTTQNAVLATLKRDHGVCWSVAKPCAKSSLGWPRGWSPTAMTPQWLRSSRGWSRRTGRGVVASRCWPLAVTD